MPRKRKERGRPPRPLPERIDATPEQLAHAFMSLPQDHEWQYLKKADEPKEEEKPLDD